MHRIGNIRSDPSGKGLNVSFALHKLGIESTAVCFLGGTRGHIVNDFCAFYGVTLKTIWTAEPTRMAVKIFEKDTLALTELNERGPNITASEFDALVRMVEDLLYPGDTLVISGSIPPGVPVRAYADLVRMANRAGAHAALDAEGEALRLGTLEKPYLLKPNIVEAEQLLGIKIQNEAQVFEALTRLYGICNVALLTLGNRGAALASPEGFFRVWPPRVDAKSTAGCGDTFLAAALVAREKGFTWLETARYASAAAGAAAELEGTSFPEIDHVERLLKGVEVNLMDGFEPGEQQYSTKLANGRQGGQRWQKP